MRVLVTGGAGFIGSHIVEYFQGKADVCVLDNLRTGFRDNLEGFDCEFIKGSITNKDIVSEAVNNVDYIFHMAAMISVPESMEKPVECVEINTIGTLNILEQAAKAGVKKLCFSSSAAIYGDNPVVPKVEAMLPEPKSPYAVTKLDGEYYCKMFNDEGWLQTACLRYFNVFGPRQDPKSQYAAAVPIFTEKALKNETITIYGDGEQTRDFIFVKDVVNANIWLSQQDNVSGIFNIAYGKSQTINDLAKRIIKLTSSNSKIEHGPVRAGDVKHSRADINRLSSTGLKFVPFFDEALGATVSYFKTSKV